MVGGSYDSSRGQDYGYSLLTGLEELLELVGSTLFIAALLGMIVHSGHPYRFAVLLGDADAAGDRATGVGTPDARVAPP